jgi:putative CocE/NonD family hydrolase
VEWAAALPHSNGKVGMFGGSYVGATQMLAAIGHPPHLAGICPVVTASNYHENWTYQGGAFEQWFNESWTSGLAQDTLNRMRSRTPMPAWAAPFCRSAKYPVFNIPAPQDGSQLTRALAPYFLDWLAHPTYDSYWKQWSIEENYQNIQVPALTIAAWYDIFQGGSLRNYLGMKAHAGNEAARNGQHLLVAIGGHSGWGRKIGESISAPHAAEFDENAVTLDWYDYLFLGKQNEFANDKPVKIFVMGKNEWRDEDRWPLERAKRRAICCIRRQGQQRLGDGCSDTGCRCFNAEAPTQLMSTTPPIPCPPWAARSAAIRASCSRPARPERSRGAPRCARLFHAAARAGSGSHRPGDAGSLRQILCRRYGLHRQAGRCSSGWHARSI